MKYTARRPNTLVPPYHCKTVADDFQPGGAVDVSIPRYVRVNNLAWDWMTDITCNRDSSHLHFDWTLTNFCVGSRNESRQRCTLASKVLATSALPVDSKCASQNIFPLCPFLIAFSMTPSLMGLLTTNCLHSFQPNGIFPLHCLR
jgi:hypothetical protein